MKLFLLVSTVTLLQVRNVESCSGQTFGPSQQEGLTTIENNLKGFGTIGSPQVYRINCCGVLKRWKLLPVQAGVVDFHVWRPTGNGQYRLLGRNRHEVGASDIGHIRVISLPKAIRISVEDGDLIGWYHPDKAVIGYGSGAPRGILQKPMPDPYRSIAVDWTKRTEINGRTYAVEAIGEQNSAPRFVQPQLSLNMSDNFRPGSQILNLAVADDDRMDIDGLTISMASSNPYFNVSSKTRQLIVQARPPVGTHTIYLRVKDHCNATAGATVTINVFAMPVPQTLAPTYGPEIRLGPPKMNRLDTAARDGRHLWVIGVILAIAIVATAMAFVLFLARKGALPIRTTKTNPTAPPRKTTHQNDVKVRKTSHHKERKSSETKERKESKTNRESKRRSSKTKPQDDKIIV